jgi:DeoR/GlpR family transcriptional regulator of sugar metabolism
MKGGSNPSNAGPTSGDLAVAYLQVSRHFISKGKMGQATRLRFSGERRDEIAQLIEELGRASTAELSTRFGVSEVTIRKDLDHLESLHQVVRTHGGAVSAGRVRAELAFEIRERIEAEAKQAIGSAAAAMVEDGASIALDASTTALYLARNLKRRRELTVVTNGIRIAEELASTPGITVLMPGGMLRWQALSLVGNWGASLLERANIDKVFVGAAGLTRETGLSDVTEDEAAMKRDMVEAAREVIAIVDHTKWQKIAFATFCSCERLDSVVTDDEAPWEMVAALREANVTVHHAGSAHTVRRSGDGVSASEHQRVG